MYNVTLYAKYDFDCNEDLRSFMLGVNIPEEFKPTNYNISNTVVGCKDDGIGVTYTTRLVIEYLSVSKEEAIDLMDRLKESDIAVNSNYYDVTSTIRSE